MPSYLSLPFINKVTINQKLFGEKVIAIAEDLGISPNWLMVVMNNESGLNHLEENPNSSATGLIQFIDTTAKGLGTTTQKLLKMTNVEQLDYVKKYYNTYKGKIKNVADAYLAVFYPDALGKPDNYTMPGWATSANPIFDLNHDRVLTKKEFTEYVNNKYAPYLNNGFEREFNLKKKIKIAAAIIIVVVIIGTIIYFIVKKRK